MSTETPEPEQTKIPKGTVMTVPHAEVIIPWLGAHVYVKFEGHEPVEAKISAVGETHTDLTVLGPTHERNFLKGAPQE